MYLVTGASMFVPVVGLITAPILAQSLGVEGRGAVATAMAPNSLVVSVATLGLPEALTFYLGKYPALTRRVVALTCFVSTIIGGLCFAITIAFATALTGGSADLRNLLLLATALAIPTLLVNLLRGAACGLQMWRSVAAEKITNALLRLLALSLLAITGNLTIVSAILVTSLAPIIAAVAYARVMFARTKQGVEGEPKITTMIFSYGGRIWLGAVASMIHGRLSQLVITPLSDVAQLGLFVVAITISDVPLIVAMSVRDVIFGISSREPNEQQLAQASRLMMIIGGVGAMLMASVAPWVIGPLFGSDFTEALTPTWLLLAASVAGIPGIMAGAGLGAWGKPSLRSTIIVFALSINAIGMVVLVPFLGANGAALAGFASQVLASALGLIFVARTCNLPVAAFVVPQLRDLILLRTEMKKLRRLTLGSIPTLRSRR